MLSPKLGNKITIAIKTIAIINEPANLVIKSFIWSSHKKFFVQMVLKYKATLLAYSFANMSLSFI